VFGAIRHPYSVTYFSSIGSEARKGQELSGMVTGLNEILHKNMMAHHKQNRQSESNTISQRELTSRGLLDHDAASGPSSPQQGAAHHKTAFPSKGRNHSLNHSFIAPNENSTAFNHSPKKTLGPRPRLPNFRSEDGVRLPVFRA
jgi:hypothetical protein